MISVPLCPPPMWYHPTSLAHPLYVPAKAIVMYIIHISPLMNIDTIRDTIIMIPDANVVARWVILSDTADATGPE